MRTAPAVRFCRLLIVFLGEVLLGVRAVPDETSVECSFDLGFSAGQNSLPDNAFSASKGTNPEMARLNNVKGAWCIPSGETFEETYLMAKLPSPKIVTGFKCQGPPSNVYDKSYWHKVNFDVSISNDAKKWMPINSTEQFNCNDDEDEIDTVSTYSWNSSVAATYIRFTVIMKNSILPNDKNCFRFEVLGCGEDDVIPATNLNVVASEDGILDVKWFHPELWTADSQPIRLRISTFKLSFTILVHDKLLEIDTTSTKLKRVRLNNVFLGAQYNIKLNCFVGDLNFRCGNLSFHANPSCPSYWYQMQTICLYKGTRPEPWSGVKEKCGKLFEDPEGVIKSDPPPENSQMWVGSQECLNYETEKLNDYGQCCGSYSKASLMVTKDSCPAIGTRQPFVCFLQKKILFASLREIIVSSPSQKSAKLSWSYEKSGWRPFELVAKLMTADGTITSQKSLVYEEFVIFDDLKLDTYYTVEIYSPIESSKMNITKKIYMSAEGALGQVNFDVYVVWEGSLKIEWDKAQIEKAGKIIYATNYKLEWQVGETNVKNEISTDKLRHDISFPALGQTYNFLLWCEISKITFICGEKILKTGVEDALVEKENNVVTIFTRHKINKAWENANEICKKHGGFLASIYTKQEQEKIKNQFQPYTPVWIGGTNCNKNSSIWIDGSQFKYISSKIEPFTDDKCCLHIILKTDIYWKPEMCSQKQPFLCKFKNLDVVQEVKELKANQISPDKIFLTWSPPSTKWKPDVYIISKCAADKTCTEETRVRTSSSAMISVQEPPASLTLRVDSVLTAIDYKKSQSVDIKTLEVDYNVNTEGEMKLRWTRKIKEGKENNPCEVKVTPMNGDDTGTHTANGTAGEIVISGLQVATSYKFVITENGGESYSFTAPLYPSCEETKILQYEMTCYQLHTTPLDWKTAKEECVKSSSSLANPSTLEKRHALSLISKKLNEKLWINYELSSKANAEGTSNAVVNCYMVVPDMQDVIVEECSKKLQFVCEKEAEVRMLPISSLTVKTNETSALVTWSPPKSWKVLHYLVTVNKPKGKTKRSPANPVKVTSTSYLVTNLEPGTTYSFQVAAVTRTPNGTLIEGKSETQDSETNSMLESAISNDDEVNTINAYNSSVPQSLRVFHIIGCSTLIGLVGLAFLIFLFTGMWSFRDGLTQLSMQISLLIVHVLFLMMVEFPDQIDFHSASISIHFFFTACFSFLMIESFLYAKALTTLIPPSVLSTRAQVLAIGWAPVLLVIGLSAGLLYNDYPKEKHCWVNLETDLLYASVIPIGIFGTVGLGLLLACLCCRPNHNYEVDEESYIRERVMENMRWITLLVLALLSISWACGMVGMDQSDEVLLLVFIIFNIILGVTILILRCLGDAEVRQRLKSCCTSGKVSPETNGLEAFIPQKQIENPDKFKLSPPQSAPIKGTLETAITYRNVGGRQCTTTSLPAVD